MDVSEDVVMKHLRNPNLSRYYFNHRKMNKEMSYVATPVVGEVHLTLKEAYDEGYVFMTQTDDDGNIINVSYEDYMASKYDWDRDLVFNMPKPVPTSIYLGDDDRLHISITQVGDLKKEPLPTLYERNNEIDAITK